MHYRRMYPSEFVGAWDLKVDTKCIIASVAVEKITGSDGKHVEKPIVTFEKGTKRMVLCKTNAKRIAKQHGPNTDDWTGKTITLYPTSCMAFGEETECIRVR